MIDIVNEGYRPNLVVAAGDDTSAIPLMAGRSKIGETPAAYVCRRFVCHAPVTEPEALRQQLHQ